MGAPSLPLLIIIINGGHFDYLDLGCFSKQHEDFCWPKIEFQITPSRLCRGFSTPIPSPPHPPHTFSSTGTMGKSQCVFTVDSKELAFGFGFWFWLLVLFFFYLLFCLGSVYRGRLQDFARKWQALTLQDQSHW